jgi:hypothetical protein
MRRERANTASGCLVQPWEEARGRGVLAYLEGALRALDFDGAPSGDKGAGQRGVIEVDRDRVVQDAVQTRWRHRPAIGPAIRVEQTWDLRRDERQWARCAETGRSSGRERQAGFGP